MTRLKLSDSFRMLASRLQRITGGEVEVTLEFEREEIPAGDELVARAIVRSPERPRKVDYLALDLTGKVQIEDRWEKYRQTAETAQDTELEADQEIIIPLRIHVPQNAVLTEDGGDWKLKARAVLDRAIDTRQEAVLTIVQGDPEAEVHLEEETELLGEGEDDEDEDDSQDS